MAQYTPSPGAVGRLVIAERTLTGLSVQRIWWVMLHRLVSALISWVMGLFASGGTAPSVPTGASANVSPREVVLQPATGLDTLCELQTPAFATWVPRTRVAPHLASRVAVVRRLGMGQATPAHAGAAIDAGAFDPHAE